MAAYQCEPLVHLLRPADAIIRETVLTAPAGWMLLLFVLVIAGYLRFKILPRIEKRKRSESWPMIEPRVTSGRVYSEIRSGEFDHEVFVTEIAFTYLADGTEFGGSYRETFKFQNEAEQLLRSLKQGPLFVRYNPAKPGEYFMDPYRDIRKTI